jgi:hypothetical protein
MDFLPSGDFSASKCNAAVIQRAFLYFASIPDAGK